MMTGNVQRNYYDRYTKHGCCTTPDIKKQTYVNYFQSSYMNKYLRIGVKSSQIHG